MERTSEANPESGHIDRFRIRMHKKRKEEGGGVGPIHPAQWSRRSSCGQLPSSVKPVASRKKEGAMQKNFA